MQSSKVGKYTLWYHNPEEFRILKREIFGRNDYYVEIENPRPLIVDAGAFIGDTVLYFKQLYPDARVIAIEPFPENQLLLKKNVDENQLRDVRIVEGALSPQDGSLTLYADKSGHDWFTTISHHEKGWDKRQETRSFVTPSYSLQTLVPEGHIDLLKLDVEGMESAILTALKGELHRIGTIVAEVHPVDGRFPISLFRLLEQAGYTIEVRVEGKTIDDPTTIHELCILTAIQ